LYTSRNNDMYDSSDEEPVPRFRYIQAEAEAEAGAEAGAMHLKSRFKRTYELRETKPVCYTESEDDE
jgi:hypothetical protein